MYDVCSEESFAGLETWINELRENVQGPLVIALVGNKCDMPEKRTVPTESGKEFALSHDCLFFETSAKSDTGIVDLFQEMCQAIVKAHVAQQAALPSQPTPPTEKGIFLDEASKPKKGCEC